MLYLSKANNYIRVPLFEHGYVLLYNNKDMFNEVVAELSKEIKLVTSEVGRALSYEDEIDGLTYYLMGVFDNEIGTLVHEAAHIVFAICNDVNIPIIKQDSNEVYCYLIDCIVSRFYRNI